MSATEIKTTVVIDGEEQEIETAERPFLVAGDARRSASGLLTRKFDIEITDTDGRTIEALCVPYNIPAEVADPPRFERYKEMFVKGSFARAVKAPFRVWLNFEHQPGFANVIGSGVRFEERDDGLYGELEVDEGHEGDKALRFVHKNVLRSLSVEFKPMTRDVKNEQGIVVRRSVHLDAVALCRQGAYGDAKVLAVREDTLEPEIDEALKLKPLDPVVVERCRRLGIALPQRYQAQPDETDTPDDSGTSEDGTRPTP